MDRSRIELYLGRYKLQDDALHRRCAVLTSWQIWDFKSFGSDTTPLTLPGVTVLVGANSSGKSSIIQTILLMKQTFQYGGQERPVLLNGPLLRLGNFYDVKNALSSSRGFRISFNVNLREPPEAETPLGRNLFLGRQPQVAAVAADVIYGLDAGKSADEIS